MLHTSTFNSTSIKKFCYFLKTTLKTLFRDYLLNIVLLLDDNSKYNLLKFCKIKMFNNGRHVESSKLYNNVMFFKYAL